MMDLALDSNVYLRGIRLTEVRRKHRTGICGCQYISEVSSARLRPGRKRCFLVQLLQIRYRGLYSTYGVLIAANLSRDVQPVDGADKRSVWHCHATMCADFLHLVEEPSGQAARPIQYKVAKDTLLIIDS